MTDFSTFSTADLLKRKLAAQRQLKIVEARKHLLPFLQIIKPDPEDPDDVSKSQYQVTPQGKLLCEVIEDAFSGKGKRNAVSIAPQHGKSEVLTRATPAWWLGRRPNANIIVGTYNQPFANIFGDDIRNIIESPAYKQVFPKLQLDAKAKDFITTTKGGKLSLAGVGGSSTGKAADIFIVDDPFKDDADANSETYRNAVWKWFTSVVYTRLHNNSTVIVVHCLTGDTPVAMADGTSKPMRDVRPGEWVLAYDGGKPVSRRVTAWAEMPADPIIELRTGNSRVRGNARHPVLVSRPDGVLEWVTLGQIAVGDRVVCAGKWEFSDSPEMTETEAWLLGFMFGDGWLTIRDATNIDKQGRTYPRRGVVTCCAQSKYPDLNARVLAAFKEVFGAEPKLTRFGYWRTEVQRVGRWFQQRGLEGGAKTKRIPDWLFSRTLIERRAFLLGFSEADGHVDKTKQTTVACANRTMVEQLRHLARFAGIRPSNLHEYHTVTQAPHSREMIASDTYSFKWGERREDAPFSTATVRSITHLPAEPVYDLTVDGAENFIADGVVVHNTRWHEDDLIGRLCDPDHPERNKKYKGVADDWLYINLPAVVTDPQLATALGLELKPPPEKGRIKEQFGDQPMAALWEARKSLDFLAEARNLDARVFDALYMGKPAPDDGEHFTAEMLIGYQPEDLPKNLRKYGASDHAVTANQSSDSNVIGCLGVDEDDNIWILPDLVWNRMKTDRVVENILAKMQQHKPALWWMEDELISKSFGPFLLTRMREEKTYYTIDPVRPARDKVARSQAIQGRMSMRKVKFPVFAPWWRQARSQLLKFPYGTHDDFVDWLSLIGQGMLKLYAPSPERREKVQTAPTGSIEWILAQSKHKARIEQQESYSYAY